MLRRPPRCQRSATLLPDTTLLRARALMMEPRILLLDEPTAGLAPMMVDEMFSTIRTISAAGTAVLMVEQNAKRALAYVDRGYVLENGHVRFDSPPGPLLATEGHGRLYLGGRNQEGREQDRR